MIDVYFFGVWSRSGLGHYLFSPSGHKVYYRNLPGFPLLNDNILDAGLLPNTADQPEGIATFVHLNGWTIISFWDRSIDSRMGSNSSFVMRGNFDFSEACNRAKAVFPSVWARFAFPVVERKAK